MLLIGFYYGEAICTIFYSKFVTVSFILSSKQGSFILFDLEW